jgi:hypothetical protein
MKRIASVLLAACLQLLLVAHCHGQQAYPDSLNKKRLHATVGTASAAYVGGLSYLGLIWYKDKERVPFHFYNDGKGYLQADKLGHAFGAYHESRLSYEALRWAGLDKKRALIYGAPVGLLFQTPIEVFDGLYEGWGFSWWDMVANTGGAALFAVQEALWDEQVVTMKFSYSPSGYPRYHSILGDNEWESFFLDYNGHSYWLSANLRSLTGAKRLPVWLNLGLGYSINGVIKEFENPQFYQGQPFPSLERYRQWVLSPDIDFTRIPTNKRWLRRVFRYANMIKLPFPAVEFNRISGIRLHALYF